MTTPSTQRKAGPFLGNAVQTAWPFEFKIFAPSDIKVTVADADGIESVLVLDTDYSVSLNVNQDTSPGGTVTYPISGAALAVGRKLTVTGNLPYDQPLDLPSGGNFSPLALENQLDRTVMQVQQLREESSRSIKLPVTSNASVDLPQPEGSKFLAWNFDGSALINADAENIAIDFAYADWVHETFEGDGSRVSFSLQKPPGNIANLDLSVDGLSMVPGVDFTLLQNVVTFLVAPADGAQILARYGQPISQFPVEVANAVQGPFLLLDQQITYDFEIPAGKNALSISPAITAGVTVTVPPGSKFITLDEYTGGGGGGGGEANTGYNVGGGIPIYDSKSGAVLNFRSLIAGTGITMSSSPGQGITINATAVPGGSGEVNTASNLGAGVPVYDSKSGVDLRFRSLVAGSGIDITSTSGGATTISNTLAPGEVNTASNVGTGTGTVFKVKSGANLQFKTLKAGANVTLVNGTDDITINATTSGGGGSGLPIVNVMDYGADNTGATASNTAFNNAAAAAADSLVYVPAGTYNITSQLSNSATWWLAPGAVITGQSTVNGMQNTSRLTGRIVHYENDVKRSARFGSPSVWLESNYWRYSQSIAEVSAVSRYSEIGIMGASRTSDNPAQTLGSIGVAAYSVNDSTSPKEPAWGIYVNHQKVNGSGPSYGMEIDNVNKSATFNATPYTMGDGMTSDRSFNLWLTCGAGDGLLGAGNAVSAAIGISANPTPFNRGMIFPSGCVNATYNEIITSFNGGRIAWYDFQGSVERLSGYISSAGPVAGLDFMARDETSNTMALGMRLDGSTDSFRPIGDNLLELGYSGNRWKNLHAVLGNVGGAVSALDGGEATAGANSIGRSNPLRSASSGSTLKLGHGTSGSPVSANSPALWHESWVSTDYTALGDGSQFAQGVAGALFQTFKTGGTGGVNGLISLARANSNTAGDIIGMRGIADGKDRTSGATTFCGVWGEVESPGTNYGYGCYGVEINAFTNYSGSSAVQDPFTSSGGKVTGLLVNNYQKAGTPGNYKNHFGIAVTSLTASTREKGYHTGLYISDCDSQSIRLFGGARASDDTVNTSSATSVGIQFQGRHQTGIEFSTACMGAGVGTPRGDAIRLGDNKVNMGQYTGATFNEGDMWFNSGILYIRAGGANRVIAFVP